MTTPEPRTVGQLTDEELSLWIANFLEPLSTLEPMPTGREDKEAFPDVSPLRFWVLATRPEWHWKPTNSVNDPACTVMLIERMLPTHTMTAVALSAACFQEKETGQMHGAGIFKHDYPFRRAIAQCFALANGYKE